MKWLEVNTLKSIHPLPPASLLVFGPTSTSSSPGSQKDFLCRSKPNSQLCWIRSHASPLWPCSSHRPVIFHIHIRSLSHSSWANLKLKKHPQLALVGVFPYFSPGKLIISLLSPIQEIYGARPVRELPGIGTSLNWGGFRLGRCRSFFLSFPPSRPSFSLIFI